MYTSCWGEGGGGEAAESGPWPPGHPAELPLCEEFKGQWQLTNKQAGWFLRPDCAPSLECPPSFDRCTLVLLVDCCCTLVLHSTSSERIPFDRRGLPEWQISKSISSVSFVRIESNFFTIHRRHRREK